MEAKLGSHPLDSCGSIELSCCVRVIVAAESVGEDEQSVEVMLNSILKAYVVTENGPSLFCRHASPQPL